MGKNLPTRLVLNHWRRGVRVRAFPVVKLCLQPGAPRFPMAGMFARLEYSLLQGFRVG